MAMQVTNPKKAEHMRAFNPERDMIWALPRLMSRIFNELGELSDNKLTALLEGRCIGLEVHRYPHANVMGETAKELARMFNLMQQFPEKSEEHAKEYKRLKEERPLCMALTACLLMDVVFSELPTWFDQVRPTSKLSPTPNIEEVEQAAHEFLDRITG